MPEDAIERMYAAFSGGVVFVVSLWGGFPGATQWMDGGCNAGAYPQCDIENARFKISNLHILGGVSTPWRALS